MKITRHSMRSESCSLCDKGSLSVNGNDLKYPYSVLTRIEGRRAAIEVCDDCLDTLTKLRATEPESSVKTRCIWEESDIVSGRYIIRESSPKGSDNISFAASVTYKIGYAVSNKCRQSSCLVSITDGMVLSWEDEEDLTNHLNNDSYGFRPLLQDEVIKQIQYLKTMNEGIRE